MSLFDNLDTTVDASKENDVVAGAGFSPLESDIYDFTIEHAFIKQSTKGAYALSIALKTDDGRSHREDIYFTNRNGQNTYKDKQSGDLRPMPGYTQLSSLCLLVLNTDFPALKDEMKEQVIKLYDYDARSEVPTKVNMIAPLVGKTVRAAILQTLENKNAKNDAGDYVPEFKNGEPVLRTVVNIDKFLHTDSRTVSEIRGKEDAPVYAPKFLDIWKGQVRDKSDKKAKSSTGTAGMPSMGSSSAPAAGTKSNLFG